MSWREKLQPASFRGVSFNVATSDLGAGRRTARHGYPQRDLPYLEDMGRKAREYMVEGHIVGIDYMVGRDALLDACEQAGPGELVHPYHGRKLVVCTDIRVQESSANGGMATISMSFVEAGEASCPSSSVKTQQATNLAAESVITAAKTSVTDTVSVDGLPSFVTDAVSDLTAKAKTSIGDTLPSLSALSEFQTKLSDLQDLAGGSSLNVSSIADKIADAVGLGDTFSELVSLAEFGSGLASVPTTTASRQQQFDNQTAMVDYVRKVAAAAAANATAATVYNSYDDAIADRTVMADLLDDLSETAGDDMYRELQSLRAAVVQDLTGRAADLSRVIEYTPPATGPSLAISWRLYGEIDSSADIVSRNVVRHPGFVPGGDPLQVMSEVVNV
jgi:prophage DNA circulation protein